MKLESDAKIQHVKFKKIWGLCGHDLEQCFGSYCRAGAIITLNYGSEMYDNMLIQQKLLDFVKMRAVRQHSDWANIQISSADDEMSTNFSQK